MCGCVYRTNKSEWLTASPQFSHEPHGPIGTKYIFFIFYMTLNILEYYSIHIVMTCGKKLENGNRVLSQRKVTTWAIT